MVGKFFKQFDLFAASPTLRARSEPEITNICGGVLSFFVIVIFLILFIINCVGVATLSEISVTIRQEQYDDGLGQVTDIMFGIGFHLLPVEHFNSSFVLSAELVNYEMLGGEKQFLKTVQIPLQRCQKQQWTALGDKLEQKYQQYNIQNKYCPKPGQKLTIKNSRLSPSFQYIRINVSECQKSQSFCPEKNFTIIEQFLDENKYVQTSFLLLHKGFTPSKKEPTFTKVTDIRSTFTDERSTEVLVQLSNFEIQSDVNLSPFISIETEKGFYIKSEVERYFEKRGFHPDMQYNLFFNDEYKIIERQYGKFDEMLSYVGGLFAIIIGFIGFFMLSFNQYRYELMVAEGAFNYDDDGKKIHARDLSYSKFLKYAAYDWIMTLTCCELKWQQCLEIERTREEANHQLDVSLLFKKLQHIDRSLEYLVSERQQLCLYLTQPPSIREVRKKRMYAEYYDTIIKGSSALTLQDIKTHAHLQSIFSYAMKISDNSVRYGQNSRIKEDVDHNRENILSSILEKYQEEEQIQLDEQQKQIQEALTESFFHMNKKNKARIQQKIPIKILKRLEIKLKQINARKHMEIKL